MDDMRKGTFMKTRNSLCALALAGLLTLGAAAQSSHADTMSGMAMKSRYAGPVYSGAPALSVTSALVAAGGGADNYSTATALTTMVGAPTVTAEVGKLTKQYGKAKVTSWLTVFDFAVNDSLKIATKDGISLPAPDPTLTGTKLATTLVDAGLAPNGVFYIEFLLDKAVSHGIHDQVMDDIDAKYGGQADADYHRISNQAFVDVAHALGAKQVQLSSFH
jgi:hypothetical protein